MVTIKGGGELLLEKHIFQRMDGWINIAWHGHIDEEHGAMFTRPHHLLDHRFLDERLWGTGRTEHNIRLPQIRWELLPGNSCGLECLRQLCGTLRRAVGYKEAGGAPTDQGARCPVRGFALAPDHDPM